MFKKLNKKGFTLVELMIVVVILGILVAIAVPIYSVVTKNAEKKTCFSNMRMITSTCIQYYMEHESYDGLIPAAGTDDFNSLTFPQEYLDKFDQGGVPECPAGGNYKVVIVEDSVKVTCIATAELAEGHGDYHPND